MGLISAAAKRVQFLIKSDNTENTVITLHASIKETHSRQSPVTEFPIEDGAVVSDHVLLKPLILELEGIISDSQYGSLQGLASDITTNVISSLLPPIGVLGTTAGKALFGAIANSKRPSVTSYVQLLKTQADREPFTIITSLYRYENMCIEELSVPRDAANGNALVFTLKAKQLLIVSAKKTSVSQLANPNVSAQLGDLGQQSLLSPVQTGINALESAANSLVGGQF